MFFIFSSFLFLFFPLLIFSFLSFLFFFFHPLLYSSSLALSSILPLSRFIFGFILLSSLFTSFLFPLFSGVWNRGNISDQLKFQEFNEVNFQPNLSKKYERGKRGREGNSSRAHLACAIFLLLSNPLLQDNCTLQGARETSRTWPSCREEIVAFTYNELYENGFFPFAILETGLLFILFYL